jgi:hypothetical protein
MTVECLVSIEGLPRAPRQPYVFAVLPRVEEIVTLEDGSGQSYRVTDINHIAQSDGADPLVILFLKRN